MLPHYPHEDIAPRIFFATGFLLLITLLVSWFFARRISNPFSNFVIAANKLGRGETPEPLAQEGPEDIRQAAAAFNQMQDRLTRLIDSQRTMLRAVGHDLRTPLTAMRIHVESLQEDETQNALISSIDDMTALTEDILNWAKDMSGLEDLAPVNLSSFLGSIVEDYIGQGADVSFEEPAQIIAKIRRVAMKRALQNLINNGLKYGQAVKLSLEKSDDHIAIHIDDEGPGIPDAELENVLNPFVRLEASRNKGTGGTGLGLSIAKGIVQTDGGHLELHNRVPTGLRATLTIPIN